MIDRGLLLRVNHSRSFPTHLLLLDTETSPRPTPTGEVHRFRLGWTVELRRKHRGFSYTEDWRFHDSHKGLLRYLQSVAESSGTVWLLAHNLFFDLQACGFFPYFTRAGWRLNFLYDKGLTFCLVMKHPPNTLKLLSTTNWFDVSLERLGQDVGLPKLEVDFKTVSSAQLSTYCRRDVEILLASLLKYMEFCRAHDVGRFCMTRASQSFAAFRHRFMHHKIYVHANDQVKRLERDGYFGGRTEAFQLGECSGGPFLFLDVNSMYPAVMATNRFPAQLLGQGEGAKGKLWKAALDHGCLMAEVDLDTPIPRYAFRGKDKVLFPVGAFRTVLCTESLKVALTEGHVRSVLRWAAYAAESIFKDYVEYFYPLKAQYKSSGQALYARIVKLFLNSLYGKFGSRAPVMEMEDASGFLGVSREYVLDTTTGEHWIEYAILATLVRLFGEEDTPQTFVAVAAHVTDAARLLLSSIIEEIGREYVLYCDTDSLVVREVDLGRVRYPMDAEALGALSVAEKTNRLTIHGLKDYSTDTRRKTKGLPPCACRLTDDSWQYMQFDRFITHQVHGWGAGFHTHRRSKVLSGRYDKGEVDAEGRVLPFVLGSG